MTLKSRSTTAIIIAIVLIAVATLIWAWASGKITIFGDQATVLQSYTEVPTTWVDRADPALVQVANGTISLKPTTTQSGANWSMIKDTGYGQGGTNFFAMTPVSVAAVPGELIITGGHPWDNMANYTDWVYRIGDGMFGNIGGDSTLGGYGQNNINLGLLGLASTFTQYIGSDLFATNWAPNAGEGGYSAFKKSVGNDGWADTRWWGIGNSDYANRTGYGLGNRTGSASDGHSLYTVGGYRFQGNFSSGIAERYSNKMYIFWTGGTEGSQWITMDLPSQMHARDGVSVAYVPAGHGRSEGRIYVYGGRYQNEPVSAGGRQSLFHNTKDGDFYNDVWYFNIDSSRNWQQVTPQSNGPGERAYGDWVYDPVNDQLVYFGGENHDSYYNDTWTLKLSNDQGQETYAWNQLSASTDALAPRAFFDMVYNNQYQKIYLVGGGNNSITVSGYENNPAYHGAGFNQIGQLTLPESSTTYSTGGTYTSPPIGNDDVAKFTSFDAAESSNPSGSDISKSRVIYEIVDATPDANGVFRSLGSNTESNSTHMELADNGNVNSVKSIRVRIHLQSYDPTITPWTKGFTVKYQTYGDYLPTKPPAGNPTVVPYDIGIDSDYCEKAKASWPASPDQDKEGYYIYYTPEITPGVVPPIPTSAIATVDKNTLTYELTGLPGSTKYYLWVKAFGPGGQSTPVGPTEFTTLACPVSQAPDIESFDAIPDTINAEQSSTLKWDVSGFDVDGGNSLSITPGDIIIVDPVTASVNGEGIVSPTQTTTYRLTATNTFGTTTADETVTVNPPGQNLPVISFSANPQTIDKESYSTLSWNVTNATSISIDNDIVNPTGTRSVSPNQDTTYTLTATNNDGSLTASETVVVRPDANGPTAPTNLTGTPIGNDSIKLTWNPSTDNIGVTGYDIYDATNNQLIGTTDNTEITLSGLSCNTTYKYYVKAHDAAGNVSDASNTVELKTGACTGNAGEQGSTAAIAGISKLVSTGSALWFNLLIAIALAAAIAYFLVWRKRRQEM